MMIKRRRRWGRQENEQKKRDNKDEGKRLEVLEKRKFGKNREEKDEEVLRNRW